MVRIVNSEPRWPPDFPYPITPGREPPRRTEPVMVPVVDLPSPDPVQRLFDQRTILLSGHLDDATVTHLCAQLMALDGRSARDVELVMNSPGGPLTAIAAVLDVVDTMRGRVNVTCTGTAQGTATVLLACASGQRRAGRHARISLRLADLDPIAGSGAELARFAEEVASRRRQLVDVLVLATGQPVERLEHELDGGEMYDAEAAKALGLIDEVVDGHHRGASRAS
jgi:ATP-dependent Clp protease, protease subunit